MKTSTPRHKHPLPSNSPPAKTPLLLLVNRPQAPANNPPLRPRMMKPHKKANQRTKPESKLKISNWSWSRPACRKRRPSRLLEKAVVIS